MIRFWNLQGEDMSQVIIRNPRLTATAEIELEGGQLCSVTFERESSELQVLQRVRDEVANASAVAVAAGRDPIPTPTDEDLVPVLAVLNRLKDAAREV